VTLQSRPCGSPDAAIGVDTGTSANAVIGDVGSNGDGGGGGGDAAIISDGPESRGCKSWATRLFLLSQQQQQ